MPKVSIIVPVYNVERYLCECIDSIIAQTFVDWELLLVDDGSTDNSRLICEDYASKDKRIRVAHKPNGGVSSARNVGLDAACGKWVTFIDADDKILPGFLEGLYAPIAAGEQVDFVHGGCCNMKGGEITSINQAYEYYIGDELEILFGKLRGLTFSKLFCLNNVKTGSDGLPLRFDEKMIIAEDMAFTLDYIIKVKRFAFVPERGYCYRVDNLSSATKGKKIPDYTQELHSFKHLFDSTHRFIFEKNIKDTEVLKLRYAQLADNLILIYSLMCQQQMTNSGINHRIETDFTAEERNVLKYTTKKRSKLILKIMKLKQHWMLKFYYRLKY